MWKIWFRQHVTKEDGTLVSDRLLKSKEYKEEKWFNQVWKMRCHETHHRTSVSWNRWKTKCYVVGFKLNSEINEWEQIMIYPHDASCNMVPPKPKYKIVQL